MEDSRDCMEHDAEEWCQDLEHMMFTVPELYFLFKDI